MMPAYVDMHSLLIGEAVPIGQRISEAVSVCQKMKLCTARADKACGAGLRSMAGKRPADINPFLIEKYKRVGKE